MLSCFPSIRTEFCSKEEINSQFTHQFGRLKSTDTTESNVTVIETVDTVVNGLSLSKSKEEEEEAAMEDEVEDVPAVVKDIPAIESRREKNLYYKLKKQNAKDVDEEEEEADKVLINQVERKKFIKRESVKSLMGDSRPLTSCLIRRDSSRASFKKRVMYSEEHEVIPEPAYFINEDELFAEEHEHIVEEDDEVFSDKVLPKLPRGDMCTPYPPRKGSLPSFPLPEWFIDDRWIIYVSFLFVLSLCNLVLNTPLWFVVLLQWNFCDPNVCMEIYVTHLRLKMLKIMTVFFAKYQILKILKFSFNFDSFF